MKASVFKKSKGFTLIEIIVTLAIMAIVTTAIYSMFNFENKIFYASSSQYNAQSAARLRMDSISNTLSNATVAEVVPGALSLAAAQAYGNGYSYFVIQTNTIHSYVNNGSNVFSDSAYSGFSGTSSYFSKIDNTTLRVYLVGQDRTKSFIADTKVYMKNFALMSPISFIQGTSGATVRYKLTR